MKNITDTIEKEHIKIEAYEKSGSFFLKLKKRISRHNKFNANVDEGGELHSQEIHSV